jgi:hypothetical protein
VQFVNKTQECEINEWRAIDKRDPRIAELILVHRIDIGSTPEQVAEFFAYKDKSTGGRMPYHFFVSKDGVVSQCVPLSIIAPGAKAANRAGIQVALDGDFRLHPPAPAQLDSLHELVVALLKWKPSLKVEGHMDGAGRSEDPNKVCPGKLLVTQGLRTAALEAIELEQKLKLREMGMRF